jgi:preprotein translocase subunit SecG
MLAFGPVGASLVPQFSEVVMVRIDAGIDAFFGEDDPFMSAFNAFNALFVIVPILFVGFVVLMIVLAVVNARRLKSKGISPLATNAEIMADAVRSSAAQQLGAQPAAAPAQTLEARLEEIEHLHAAGRITAAERDAARAAVLGTL